MAFKLTKYSYKSLRKMSVQDRLAAVQDKEMGQWLLSLLTPSQFVELFPDYYRRSLPDISGFTRAMPSSMSIAKQAAAEEQIRNTTTGAAAGANFKAGGWRKKWQEGIAEQQRAIPTRAGVVPPAQLSPEQRKSFDELRTSPMAADDPRAKMFAGMSAEQLAKVGISRTKDGGKDFFKYTAPSVSEEDVKKNIMPSGDFSTKSPYIMKRLQTEFGLNKSEAAAIMGNLGHESRGFQDLQEKLSSDKIARGWRGGLGWAQWTGDRRDKFIAWSKRNGLDVTSDEANLGFLIHELKTTKASAISAVKNAEGDYNKMVAFEKVYEGAGVKSYDSRLRYMQKALSSGDPITMDYSQKSMELAREKLIRQIEDKRIMTLAEFTTAQLPPPGSPQANQLVGDNKNATAVAEKIKNEFGNLSNPQCVALAKAYVGATGSVTDWRRGTNVMDGTLRPGTPIATFMDRSGNPSSLYDNGGTGAPGNHTTHAAVFLDYVRDGAGKITGIKVMEQYKGSGGAKERVYPVGGFGTNNASNYFSINDTRGTPLGPNNPMLQTAPTDSPPAARDADKPPVPTPMQPAPQVETPQVLNKPGAQNAPAPTAGAPVTQAAPVTQPGPEKYRVDIPKFINAIKQTEDFKNTPLSWMATDNMIMDGFNNDARVKAAGVRLDEKGVMHFTKGMTPEAKEAMSTFDTKSFMTKIEEKKPDVKPVSNPPVPTPAQPAPQIETPKVLNKPQETLKVEPREAPTKVKTNASGGDNKVNTEQISAYPIGGLKGDNVVVVNKQQQPLFTMNTNESVTMNPNTDMATVSPNTKERRIGEANRTSPLEGMFDKFNQSVRELSSRFDQNKPVTQQKERPEVFQPEGGAWINNLNKLTESQFHNPTARRAFYRSGGVETGEPNSGFHYSHGNKS